MRPRPDAAENAVLPGKPRNQNDASMRPRPDAAENKKVGVVALVAETASMRPRPDAAENSSKEIADVDTHYRLQ